MDRMRTASHGPPSPTGKDPTMTRLLDLIRTFRAPTVDAGVHFHSDGLLGEAIVCYDARCSRPALDA